jgi:hypothetical protein
MNFYGNVFVLVTTLCALTNFDWVLLAQNVVIEAEDFDFDGRQHLPVADIMPYYGGAYDGYSAVADVDYHLDDLVLRQNVYRSNEEPNVPMFDVSGNIESLSRGSWMVTANYRLGLLRQDANNWFNYTRDFPVGRYRVYAALSWVNFSAGTLRGDLARVSAGAGTPTQTLESLGEFRGDGAGGFDLSQLVPLMQNSAKAIVELRGPTTLRFTARSGDVDYLLFVPETAPDVTVTPVHTEAVAGSTVSFAATASGEGPFTYQWRFKGVDIPNATDSVLNVVNVRSANSGLYSVFVSNAHGSFESSSVSLRVFYPINVGDTVSPDVPLPGAGIFGGGGIPEEHVYRFSGTAGEAVFFQRLGGDDGSELQWRLRTPSGRTAFLAPFGYFPDPVGTHLLQETGEYTLTVSDPGFTTGTYSFLLSQPAHVENFNIAIGDIVDQEFPGAGSGVTDTYDCLDVFSFSVTEPTALYFRVFYGSGCYGGFQAPGQQWALIDPDGSAVFVEPLDTLCPLSLPETHLLNKTGVYKLVVVPGSIPDLYSFQLVPSTIQTHAIEIGNRIQPDQPDPGAGLTALPGEMDVYLFHADAGQIVFLRYLPDTSQCQATMLKLESPTGVPLFFKFVNDICSGRDGPALLTLPETGTYKIAIWVFDATGTHSFELLPSAGVQSFVLPLGEEIKKNHPTKGAGELDPNGAVDEFTFRLEANAQVTFSDLGSDGNRLLWTLEQRSPSTVPLFSEPLEGAGPGSLFLDRGTYRLRVTAPTEDPTISGKYRFRVDLE